MSAIISILRPGNELVLDRVAPDVFDHAITATLAAEFLADPRHHLAVAVDGDCVVGFASGVTYLHPDKPLEMWVNEVGVASSHRREGIGTRLLRALLRQGRELGCRKAWVLTNRSNDAALELYRSAGGAESRSDTVMFSFDLDRPVGDYHEDS